MGITNLSLWEDIKIFADKNGLDFGMSPSWSLGSYAEAFGDKFVFIGKDYRILGTLGEDATSAQIEEMFDRAIASFYGVYVNSDMYNVQLFESPETIRIDDLFTVTSGIDLNIELTENSNPLVFNFSIEGGDLVFSKTGIFGYSTVTMTASIPGTDYTLTRTFDVTNISSVYEDFEYADISESPIEYSFGGDAKWFINYETSYHGRASFKSDVLADLRKADFGVRVNIPSPGALSFAYRTISQKYYDILYFYIDGGLMNDEGDYFENFSGETGWRNFTCSIRGGEHTVTWSYEKDGSSFWNDDCAWVDMISFPPGTEFLPPVSEKQEAPYGNISASVSPNPFNPVTIISYDISSPLKAELSVYDTSGRKVAELFRGEMKAGINRFEFNAGGLSSGIYYSVLRSDQNSVTTKMLLTK